MMKCEEAVYDLQSCVDAWDKWTLPGCASLDKYKEAVKMALAALRGPTRERVEQIRSHWVTVVEINGKEYSKCAACQNGLDELEDAYSFCPRCGVPMTDEAVDIVMKRLEALKDGTTD